MKPKKCYECDAPAQTKKDHNPGGWSPYWCKKCDAERIERITRNLEALAQQEPPHA